ncbi:MAG: disulfide bond formation protein B [Gammaproteobacteria bacterium]|jgi:protein dithiol:quinone oxidoreductase|nr:disulfide bond formation protein B [Gammaproteobacteria bacterium]
MMHKLVTVANGKLWWLFLLVMGAAMIGIALYYQHVLSEWPCVLCIHVRILFLLLVMVAILALALFRFDKVRLFMHLCVVMISVALINRSWFLLATERGWQEGECSISLGMPEWFAIDKWLPDVFSAWTSCGYTPVIALGITMAEIIMLISILLLIAATVLFVLSFRKPV